MRPEPLTITLLCDPLDPPSPWSPPQMQAYLRGLGHRVDIRSAPDSGSDLVHALGWAAGRVLASWPAPWILTPGVELSDDLRLGPVRHVGDQQFGGAGVRAVVHEVTVARHERGEQ